jgi:nitrite reductase/ring-hydroxylating ferredoxin subunit
MSASSSRSVFAARCSEVPPDGTSGLAVEVAGRRLALFAWAGRYFAVEDRCPHQGAPLHGCTVTDGILMCDEHYWRFNLAGEEHTEPVAAFDLRRFPVEVRGDEIWVDVT